jgi:hypothetical protein
MEIFGRMTSSGGNKIFNGNKIFDGPDNFNKTCVSMGMTSSGGGEIFDGNVPLEKDKIFAKGEIEGTKTSSIVLLHAFIGRIL